MVLAEIFKAFIANKQTDLVGGMTCIQGEWC